jgi:lysyl-tRNA synthetase class II/ribosomal protein L40E
MPKFSGNSKMITCRHCGARIAAGAKICPQCGGKNKKPFYKRVWFWGLIALVAIGGMGAGGGSRDAADPVPAASGKEAEGQEGAVQTAEEKTPEKQEEVIEYTACSVSKMMEDLNANAMKASDTYKGKYLEITGRLGTIDSEGAYIALLPEDDQFAVIGVHCNVKNEEQKAQVASMSSDDTVTLRGKCRDVGEVLGYTLDIDSIDGYDQGQAAETEVEDGYIVCRAQDLTDAMHENALKAMMTYKDQKICVTGRLSNIDSSGKYISIEPEDDPYTFVNIQCYIKGDEVKAAVMELGSGDVITVRGKCTDVGELLGYSIDIESLE